MKRNTKFFLNLFIAGTIILNLTACGSKNDTSSQDTITASTSSTATTSFVPKEIKTLSLLGHTSWVEAQGFQAMLTYINSKAAETGVKIEVEKMPEGDQGKQVALTRFAINEVPDLFYWWGAANGVDPEDHFSELNAAAEWTNSFGDGLKVPSYSADGKLYGVPLGTVDPMAVMYNKKVFEAAGLKIPQNWNEFLNVCETLKAKNITPVYYSGKDSWSLQIIPLSSIPLYSKIADPKQTATDIESNKKKWTDISTLENALDRTKELIDKGYAQKSWLSDTYVMAQQALLDGTCGMYPMGSWVIGELEKIDKAKTDSDIGAFALPLDEKDNWLYMGFTYAMFAPKAAKNSELAIKTLEMMGSVEAQNEFLKAQPGIPYGKGFTVELTGPRKDLADIMKTTGKVSHFQDYFSKGYDFGSFDKEIQKFLVGAQTAKQVMENTQASFVKSAKSKNDPNF